VLSREVGSLGPGSHVLDLREGARLAPGVYVIRLIEGGKRAVLRLAKVR